MLICGVEVRAAITWQLAVLIDLELRSISCGARASRLWCALGVYQAKLQVLFSTVMVNLVRRHSIFSTNLFHFHLEPPSGAQCESCGDHPLAWETSDAVRGPKQ